jgi:hypothetical protein
MEYDDRRLRILYEELFDDTGADVHEDEGMRLLVVLAGFGAAIGATSCVVRPRDS